MKLPVNAFILLLALSLLINGQSNSVNDTKSFLMKGDIPTVSFCEMVKHPQTYFDKTIRLTAMLTQATEGQYLNDEACPLTHNEQIGIGYAASGENQRDRYNAAIRKIQSPEYGDRALVTITGILRNSSRRDFVWYQYRFDISNFEKVSHIVVPYNRELDAGITYRAEVYFDKQLGLSLVNPFRLPEHYAYRIEWTNLKEFPELKNIQSKASPKKIVFSVLSKQIKQMTENRWNVTIVCKITSVGVKKEMPTENAEERGK